MNENTSSRQHYLFALLLFMAGLLIILIFLTVRSQADSLNQSETSANINNTPPVVSGVTIAYTDGGDAVSPIDLVENSTKSVVVYGEFTDLNGCDTVPTTSLKTVLYSSANPGAAADEACSADGSDCYIEDGSCTISACTGGLDNTAHFACSFDLQYYATPTAWTANVVAGDTSFGTSTAATTASSIATMNALDLTNTNVAYGTIGVGSTSSVQVVPLDNVGNIKIDTDISGTALTCTRGTLAVTQQHFATNSSIGNDDDSYYTNGTELTSVSTTVDINLPKRTDGASSTQDFHFRLAVPVDNNSYSGTCTGTILFQGIAG